MKNILVLCTGNSCRSQMAHAYLEKYSDGRKAKIYSAGIETHGVNPRAILVLKEDGVDISRYTSNLLDEYKNIDFDILITVCDHAHENCPVMPGIKIKLHHNFTDPAKSIGSDIEIMNTFRSVRDDIKKYIKGIVKEYQLH